MARTLVCSLLGLVVCAGGPLPAQERGKDINPRGVPGEKTDSKVDRSITGHVEKVDARDEHHGTLLVRGTGALPAPGAGPGPGRVKAPAKPYHYLFRIDQTTKFLTAKGKELEHGLKSERLRGAEVRVVFVDGRRGKDKSAGADKADKPAGPPRHFARQVQLIHPGKPGANK